MAWHNLLGLLLVALAVSGQSLREQTCSSSANSAEIQKGAMATLGGIISLNAPGTNGYGCGKFRGSMQALESIRWVLDLLNKKNEFIQTEFVNNTYVPGVTLGMRVVNSCQNRFSAVAGIGQVYEGFKGDNSECTKQANKMQFGIIGGSDSNQAYGLSMALNPYDIPLISYEAMQPDLTLSGKYPNFMRTVPPTDALTEVIVKVMMDIDWKYVAIVYDTGMYGKTAFSELHARMDKAGLCLTMAVPVDGNDLTNDNTDAALDKVLSTKATGVVFFGSDSLAMALMTRGNDRMPTSETGRLQWIMGNFPINGGLGVKYMRGIISVTSTYRTMVEFEDHWVRLDENKPSDENPWYQPWFAEKNDCSFSPSGSQKDCKTLYAGWTEIQKENKKRQDFQQDQYVEPAVMAVFAYAKALRNAQKAKCGGQTACAGLVNMDRKEFYNDYLKKVDFTFTSDERVPSLASRNVLPYNTAKQLSFTDQGDIKNPSFYVWNYNDIVAGASTGNFQFKKVGTYFNKYLEFNTKEVAFYDTVRDVRLSANPTSLCPSQPCAPCLGIPSTLKYYYQPGDLTISGIFSLHNKGSSPLTCGKLMSPNQVMYMEAFIYALNNVNNDPNILRNVKLGGLAMDDCSNLELGKSFISQVQRGSLVISNNGQDPLNPNTIQAYLAAHKASLTDPLAMMLNKIKMPTVGYRAASSFLDNQEMYPYFVRAAPYIREEVKAIILLLKNYGWMHVQFVTSNTMFSTDAYNVFLDLAAKEGICVVATHNIGETSESTAKAVQRLALKPDVPVTVVMLNMEDQRRALKAMNDSMDVRRAVTLVAPSTLGNNDMVVADVQSAAEGILSTSLQRSTLNNFQNYLRSLRVDTQTADPWFQEWFNQAYGCSNGNCDLTKAINDGPNFKVMYEVESVINAVTAVAVALDSALTKWCGPGYTGVCSAFTMAGKDNEVMERLRQATFQIEDTSPPYTFRFDGASGAIPFLVNNYRSGAFNKVGEIQTFSSAVTINAPVALMDGKVPSAMENKCPQPCLECLYMFNHQNYMHVPGDLMLGAIFNVHDSGMGPFSCGDLRAMNGALYPEVFNFAINKINQGSASVKLNVKLGFIGFDGCSNPTRSQAILNRVSSGAIPSTMGMDVLDILSWVTYDSETTQSSAMFLQKLGLSLVSPAATLAELADINKYTTLFRTINSNAIVAEGMAKYVRTMGWNYVISLNSPDASNREAAKLFRDYLKGFGICILSSFEFVTDGNMRVILRSIEASTSQVVVVFAEPDRHVEEFLRTKQSSFTKPLTFIANRPWRPYAKDYRSMLANSVFFEFNAPSVNEYLTYMAQVRNPTSGKNPWLVEVYEEYFNCDFPGSFTERPACTSTTSPLSSSRSFSEDIWTLTTINAVYSLAKGLHQVLKEKCGSSYTSVCPKFRQDSNTQALLRFYMDQETFTDIAGLNFDFVQRQAARGYNLNRYLGNGNTQGEGTLSFSKDLTLSNAAALKANYVGYLSECLGSCLVCQDTLADIQNFTLIPGDMYIVGLFDVHKKGLTPFSCAEINDKHGVQLLEAFHFALDYINTGQGIFSDLGVQVGGIGLDMCQSPTLAANLVANIHSGKVKLRKDGITLTPRQIDAYIATMDTESSVRVADILDQLLVPQISYGASGMELLNRKKYDYFLRSVPADDKMGRAIISYLKKFGYNNIQVIKSFDEIGEPGGIEFERLAKINLVCITKTYLIGENGNLKADAMSILNTIQTTDNAQVVVLWMKDPLPVLEAVSSMPGLYNRTLFVATDKWGADPKYLQIPSIRNLLNARNLILLDVETADVPGFDDFLALKTPDTNFINPWFKEYYEMFQGCNWAAGTCDQYETIPRMTKYVQDPYVLYVVNAVFSAALGIKGALKELCAKSQMSGMCNLYSTSGERRQKVLAHLKKINFVDDTHQPFFFTSDGQSDRGFHFFNITKKGNNFAYENVGSYNDSHFLKLDITYDNNFNAKCDPRGVDPSLEKCTCPLKPDLPTRFMKKDEEGRGLTLVYVGDVHQSDPMSSYGCGDINTGVDLYRMLAFFYAIDRINSNLDFDLPDSISLNGVALDSCTTGLRLGQDVYNVLSGNPLCDSDETGQVIAPSSITAFIVDKDKNAVPVSTMLSPQGITSISPTATNPALDDRYLHSTFLRTRGSDQDTNRVILQIADRLNWNMLGVIYTDNSANRAAKNSLLAQAESRSNKMCVGSMASLSMSATAADAANALDKISQQTGVTGVVLFVEPAHFRLLMETSRALGSTGIVWIIPNDWPEMEEDASKYRSELTSSLWIQTQSLLMKDFNDYVKQFSMSNRMGIPNDWFEEIYESLHGCKILNLQNRASRLYTNLCTGDEKITDAMLTKDSSILHVIISVYAAALGLNNIPQCKGTILDVAACLQLQEKKYDLIYRGILGVNFKVLPQLLGNQSMQFSFNREGNGEMGYLISSRSERGNAIYLGDYSSLGLNIDLNKFKQTTSFNQGGLPTSRCAPGVVCKCYSINGQTYDFAPEGVQKLQNVQIGKRYRDPQTGKIVLVKDIPQVSDRFNDIWAIIMMVIAIIGAIMALALFIYLLVMYPVRGGTSILGYITCFGIFLLYLMVFAFIAHADEKICALRRFGLGIVYIIPYAALMVKLIDCWRVRGKNDMYSAKYSKLGRPMGLFLVTLFLVLVQAMINAEWLILKEPQLEYVFYNEMYWPRCKPDDFYDEGLVLSLVYVMCIICLSFILGICTFTLNVNHREARWVFGVFILSIPCWVIWCSVATLGAYKVRDAAVAVGLLINATFMLLLMPVRKLYLLHKYNVMIEEEDKQTYNDGNSDYASVYGRTYDNRPQMHTGSVRG